MTNQRTKIEGMVPDISASGEQKRELDQAERDFRQRRSVNDPQPQAKHHERGPEQGRVYELNAEFLNQRLENYVEKFHQQETKRVEKKYGKGLWGKLNRWLEETDIGKALKVGTKVIGGGIAAGMALVGSAGLAAPLALSLGARAVVDGVLEGTQYLLERRTIQNLNRLRSQRVTTAIDLATLRNQMQAHLATSGIETIQTTEQNMSTGERYYFELESLIGRTANIEEQILNQEKNINLSQKRWKIGRFIAGLATVGFTTAYMGIYGIKTGVHDLDKLKASIPKIDNSSGVLKIKEMVPYPSKTFVLDTLTPKHETRLYLDGLNFIYNKADDVKNATQIARAGGVLTHLVNKGWWGATFPKQLYFTCAASVAGLSAAAGKEIADMIKLGKLSREDLDAAIMSIRQSPRPTIQGADQEVAANVVNQADQLFDRTQINEIWSIHGTDPTAPVSTDPEYLFKVKTKNERQNKIQLIRINRDTGQEEGSTFTINANDFYNLQNGNNNYSKKGNDLSSIISQEKAQRRSQWEGWLNNNGIQQGQYIRLDSAGILNDNRGNALTEDRDYKIESINPELGTAQLTFREERVVNGRRRIRDRIVNINLQDLQNTMSGNNSNEINIEQIVDSAPNPNSNRNQNFENLLNTLITNGIISDGDRSEIRLGKTIFEHDGDAYVINSITPTSVRLSRVDDQDRVIPGHQNRISVDITDFANQADTEFTGAKARRR